MNKITSATYDEHIIEQGEDFQIKTYYELKDLSEKRRVDIILKYLSPASGEKILDIGCGAGTFVFHGTKKGADCFGVDYSIESLKMAKKISERYELKGKPGFIAAEAYCLPFPAGTFDKITVVDFVEHIYLNEKDMVLGEAFRVLKDDGFIVVYTPNKIRERLGELYWKVRHFLFGDKIPQNDLHYGLTGRQEFEELLRKHGFIFDFYYHDVTRPYLAGIPLLNYFLSLNLLWVARKKSICRKT